MCGDLRCSLNRITPYVNNPSILFRLGSSTESTRNDVIRSNRDHFYFTQVCTQQFVSLFVPVLYRTTEL